MFLIRFTQTVEKNGYKAAKGDAVILPVKKFDWQLEALDFLIKIYEPGGFSAEPAAYAISMYQDFPSGDVELSLFYTSTLTDHIKHLFGLEAGQNVSLAEATTSF